MCLRCYIIINVQTLSTDIIRCNTLKHFATIQNKYKQTLMREYNLSYLNFSLKKNYFANKEKNARIAFPQSDTKKT